MADEASAGNWAIRHPAWTTWIVLGVLLGGWVGWRAYQDSRTTPTYTATLNTSIRIHNLYRPWDDRTVQANTLLTLVCQVTTGDSVGAYGALDDDNRYFMVGSNQLALVPAKPLPQCADGLSMQPHTDSNTKWYIQPNPDDTDA